MDKIYAFGFRLAELTGVNNARGVGLLCLAIKDAGKEAQEMSYQDFKQVFENHLKNRLEESHPGNSAQIVSELLRLLSQKQSLFTMAAH